MRMRSFSRAFRDIHGHLPDPAHIQVDIRARRIVPMKLRDLPIITRLAAFGGLALASFWLALVGIVLAVLFGVILIAMARVLIG